MEEAQTKRGAPPSAMRAAVDRPSTVLREPTVSGDWPATAPIGSIDYDDYRISTRPAIRVPTAPHATSARPVTVIPVPPLPTIEISLRSRMEPVVRTHAPTAAEARLAKGTGPVDPSASPATSRRRAALVIDEATAHLEVGDRTTPGVAPARHELISDERTKPGIMPPAARAVALPSTKRRNAPR